MAIALANNLGTAGNFTSGGLTTIALTTTATATVGQFIVVIVGGNRTGVLSSITDSASNTWALDVNAVSAQNSNVYIATCQVTTQLNSGATITATWAVAQPDRFLNATAWTGMATSAALDKTVKTNRNNLQAQVWQSAVTATTAQADELIIGGAVINAASSYTSTPGTGYTEIADTNTADHVSFTSVYQIVAVTGTYNVNGSWSAATISGDLGTIATATYKAAGGAPPVTPLASTLMMMGVG